MIRFYNFLTRKKEVFKPLRRQEVGLYTCGPTVYHYAHIGNLRTYIFEDVLRRTLEFSGYRVRHVMNLTDVGHLTSDADTGADKVEQEARKERKSVWQIASFYTKAFVRDIEALGIQRAHTLTPATKHIRAQIQIIKKLFRRGFGYETSKAVYFHVPKFKGYAKLSRQPLTRRVIGAREGVVVDREKKHPADFVLWFKLVGRFKNHIMRWPSPWGLGFPGWHIECSAISSHYLGQPFDIHTGGIDHLSVHHTNEVAQSEGAYGKPLAKFWIEGEHLMVDGEKMSKSLGNVYTLRDLKKQGFDSLDFRSFVLGAHYRAPQNFTWKAVAAARQGRLGLLNAINRLREGPSGGSLKDENEALAVIAAADKQFRAAIGDDLNTPKALAILNELLHYTNALIDRKLLTRRSRQLILATVVEFDRVLGLNLEKRQIEAIPAAVRALAEKREELRKAKRWAAADRIRNQMRKLGYVIYDTPGGPGLKKFR